MPTPVLKISDKQIVTSIVVPAPLSSVWHGWSTGEGFGAFLGARATIELWRGGKFEVIFLEDAEPGQQGSEGCTVISFVPHEMISFTWNAPPDQPFVRNHDYMTWVAVFFKEVEGGTEVRLVHTGWPEGPAWQIAFDYFSKAWPWVLNAQKTYWESRQ